ncbi:hypothetical protein GIB67_007328 [Kingdonia uniflora]|uniref:Uncharacterized protein n=1 Tax=Kingdonia uniflora TaxID=39325 RepID=A0A7J7NX77_9MAGN|nr:hypothetical protein GIB67_007328 [Kingdonia uniflora]
MKFGKEFRSKMVHEWEDAYMNYNYLKLILKDIISFREKSSDVPKRRDSLYRDFSGIRRRVGHLKEHVEEEDHVILVNGVESDGRHKTMFLMLSEEGGEYELVYFRRLDDELNKVIKFYKAKVEEVFNEAEEIDKQMDALIVLRAKVNKPEQLSQTITTTGKVHCKVQDHHIMDVTNEVDQISSSSARAITHTGKVCCEIRKHHIMDGMDEVVQISSSENESSKDDKEICNEPETRRWSLIRSTTKNHSQVLKNVKINTQPETPWLTLKGLISDSNTKSLTFSKEELRDTEEQLRLVFIEFHQKLLLLESYSYQNLLAFATIMTKYDKITSRNASKAYLKMVNSSYLGSSDEVTRLMERAENTFIHHFSNANRTKGIRALKPKAKKERHWISFCSGLLTGCSIALIVALILLVQASYLFQSKENNLYMKTMLPLYSMFGFVILHMLMYSANIYFWRRYRVNYPFIFGFKQGRSIGYREVFLLSAGLSVLSLAGAILNLDMEMNPRAKSYMTLTELVPLGLVIVVMLITFCPFNIIYRSSRFFLIRAVFRCICAPLYKVTTIDMILADQLTSQVQAFRCLEFYVCYYGWGDFRSRQNHCSRSNDVYKIFHFVVAVIPYWIRMVQSIRICIDDNDMLWGYNAVKYFSTIIAVILRTGYEFKKGNTWLILAVVSSAISGVYSTYWDLVVDWGLLQKKSKNRWLRDKLLLPHKSTYYGAMVVNVILRFAWLQSVLGVHYLLHIHRKELTAAVASLEILRRGIWNIFRVECLHLSNVGKYRAFKVVPLPFNFEDVANTNNEMDSDI